MNETNAHQRYPSLLDGNVVREVPVLTNPGVTWMKAIRLLLLSAAR